MQQRCQKQELEKRKAKRGRACGGVRSEKRSAFGLMIEDSFSSLFSISYFLIPISDLLVDKGLKIQHSFQDIASEF